MYCLSPNTNTQLPGVIGCNLIRLGCEEFKRSFGSKAFEEFPLSGECSPSSFFPSYARIITRASYWRVLLIYQQLQVTSMLVHQQLVQLMKQVPNSDSNNILGQVWVGIDNKTYLYTCQLSQSRPG